MFNSYEYNPSQKVSINSVSGTLTKTCEKSWFESFKYGQNGFEWLTDYEPHLTINGRKEKVIVLQAMLMGDERMLFEVIKKADFEQLKEQSND